MHNWMTFEYPRELVETHPIYRRERGFDLPWWRRGVIPLYITLIYVMALVAAILFLRAYITESTLTPIVVTSPGVCIYAAFWVYRASARLEWYRKSGTLTELSLTPYPPSLSLCALAHAHAQMLVLYLVPLFGLMYPAVLFSLVEDGVRMRTQGVGSDALTYLIILPPILMGAVAIIIGFLTGRSTVVRISSSIIVYSLERKLILIAMLPMIAAIPSFMPAQVNFICFAVSAMALVFVPVSIVTRAFRGYRELTPDQWEDMILRYYQGEKVSARDYIK